MSIYRISLDQFTGPLDLLWHLIRTEELDLLDLDVARITDSFVRFIEQHGVRSLPEAYHFLAMAASLVELKTRLLLPPEPKAPGEGPEGEEEEDPRAELVQRLQTFRSIQDVTGELERRFDQTSRHWTRQAVERFEREIVFSMDSLSAFDLMATFQEVLTRPRFRQAAIFREPYGLEEAREEVQLRLREADRPLGLAELLDEQPDVLSLIVTFLAVLELIKEEHCGFETVDGAVQIFAAAAPAL